MRERNLLFPGPGGEKKALTQNPEEDLKWFE